MALEVLPTVRRWETQARCRGHEHELFANQITFERATDADIRLRRARRLCSMCPVREPCLRRALEGQWTWDDKIKDISRMPVTGVWAGTTELEREAVADLPRERQIVVLLAQFREKALHGDYPVATEREWVG